MSIHLERTQSLLKELLIEALSSLDDARINSVNITDVRCSKGKYNAQVFIQADSQDKPQILKALRRAQGILREYVLSNSGWFKCPQLEFIIDESMDRAQNLERLFASIAQEKRDTHVKTKAEMIAGANPSEPSHDKPKHGEPSSDKMD